jgi:hypothetical protein
VRQLAADRVEVELVLGPGALAPGRRGGDGAAWRRRAGVLVAWRKRKRAAELALHRQRTTNWRG